MIFIINRSNKLLLFYIYLSLPVCMYLLVMWYVLCLVYIPIKPYIHTFIPTKQVSILLSIFSKTFLSYHNLILRDLNTHLIHSIRSGELLSFILTYQAVYESSSKRPKSAPPFCFIQTHLFVKSLSQKFFHLFPKLCFSTDICTKYQPKHE